MKQHCQTAAENLAPGSCESNGAAPASADEFNWPDWSAKLGRLNAPREDGAHLIEPPLDLAGVMVAANRRAICGADYDIQGRSICQVSSEARKQLLAAAEKYTRSYRNVTLPAEPKSIFLAGHQPEMFHPGVWYKNFVLARLARDHHAVAVNLQIDSDAMKSSSLRVPAGSLDEPDIEAVPFDRAVANAPFEQRTILDHALFESFGNRAAAFLQSLVPDPLLKKYWPLAVARSRETNHIGASLSQARHQLEAKWGVQSLEIPQSLVCDLPAFRWFIAHLLSHLPRLWEIYNTALLEYRRQHKVRSSAHPVPELAAEADWLEAPLWIWTTDDPRRRRLFVRQRDDELILSDRGSTEATLTISPEGDATAAVEQLAALSASGIHIRTRALITTLAARVLLGDLFVHGIGGAKYDQLTDRIISRFFGIDPPGYVVVSGTLRLPITPDRSAVKDERVLRRCIRELEFHPERFLSEPSPTGRRQGEGAVKTSCSGTLTPTLSPGSRELDGKAIAEWIAEKRRWIATQPTPENSRERCHAIRRANEALQPAVAPLREAWSAQTIKNQRDERTKAIFASREYGFVLFPEVTLTNFLLPILENSADAG